MFFRFVRLHLRRGGGVKEVRLFNLFQSTGFVVLFRLTMQRCGGKKAVAGDYPFTYLYNRM